MQLFGRAQWLFSLKLFTAAMMAYALSVHLALPQSYWAVVTCCVVMNPTTGGVLSKAVLRMTGTVCAGLSALILASIFGSTPILLITVAGLLAAGAFAWAVLDRTPRAYGFQLFGVTLLLVAVASIDHPELMFNTAVARILEIGVGIFCCTVVDSVLAPRSLAPMLRQRVGVWLPHMQDWMGDVFLGKSRTVHKTADQQKSIADITSLTLLVGQLRYDPMVSRWERQCAAAVQQRLLRLMPLLSSIEAHLASLAPERKSRALQWMAQSWTALDTQADSMPFTVDGIGTRVHRPSRAEIDERGKEQRWQELVEANLVREAREALHIWDETRKIAKALTAPATLSDTLKRKVRAAVEFPLNPDFYMAGRVALATLLAYGLLAMLWWTTGWVQGANVMLLATVAIGFFGNLDEAGKAIGAFAKFSAIALVLAAVISYGLLPLAQDFLSLALLFGLVMLPLGAWAATNPLAVLLLAMAFSNTNLQSRYMPWEFGFFLDSVSGCLLGILTGYFCLVTVRRMGPAHLRQRFIALEKQDIDALTRKADPRSLGNYVNRALDRAGGMAIRMTSQDGGSDLSSRLLAWLRLGVAVGSIRLALQQVGGRRRRVCEALLERLRHELRGTALEPSTDLKRSVDASLHVAAERSRHESDALLRGLIDLRLALFPPLPDDTQANK